MPFTPFHFGPAATLSIPLHKRIDLPAFLLANIVVDLEPLYVLLSGAHYPLHGFVHTILFGGLAGALLGIAIFVSFRLWSPFMKWMRLSYSKNPTRSVLSGISGAWLHVFIDAIIYKEMVPFYPFDGNPLFGLFSKSQMYWLCFLSFIPAILLYFVCKNRHADESSL